MAQEFPDHGEPLAERGDDVKVDGGAVEAFRLGLAVDLHVGVHAVRREVGDGGVGLGLRRDRVEVALDTVDDLGRLPARQGRNPATVERIDIAASKTPSFKAGKALHDAVR